QATFRIEDECLTRSTSVVDPGEYLAIVPTIAAGEECAGPQNDRWTSAGEPPGGRESNLEFVHGLAHLIPVFRIGRRLLDQLRRWPRADSGSARVNKRAATPRVQHEAGSDYIFHQDRCGS